MTSTLPQFVRLRLDLAYDGSGFHGWAKQPGLRTVQGELEKALETVFRKPVQLTVAGRTDAGVHALGQVAHGDIVKEAWDAVASRATGDPEDYLVRRLNSVLSRQQSTNSKLAAGLTDIRGFTDVVIHQARIVPGVFDARFSALWRAYTYRVADGIPEWNPVRRDVLWLAHELDIDAMNEAAKPLLGEHDFLSFCKPREGASTVRTLFELECERDDEGIIVAFIRADAFCHSQVRTLMGTLMEVGRGARPVGWPAERLMEADRQGEVIVAPGHPLTLQAVGYPETEEFGAQASRAKRFRGKRA